VPLKRGAVVMASHRDPSDKPRPFLVLRSDHFAAHVLVTVLAFTGTCTGIPPLRITVQPTLRNGLQQPSQAMIDYIQSVRIGQIGQVIGELDKADMQAIERAVAVYLGFADRAGAADG
jgi:mRNA interferase MazF